VGVAGGAGAGATAVSTAFLIRSVVSVLLWEVGDGGGVGALRVGTAAVLLRVWVATLARSTGLRTTAFRAAGRLEVFLLLLGFGADFLADISHS
jgi:hypothetical protein